MLVQGEGACDAAVMEAIFHKKIGPPRDAESPYYYPPTAALLLAPAGPLPYAEVAVGFRWVSLIALVGAAAAVMGAVPVRDPVVAAAGVGGLATALVSLRLVRGSLLAGQTGPVVVGLTAAALWAVGRRRDRGAGALLAVGVALKLFPALVLPALVRRPRVWLAFGGVLLGLVGLTWIFPHPDAPFAWLAGAAEFVDRPMRGAWEKNEPAWVLQLWRARFLGLGVPTALATGVHLRRPRTPAADTALGFLWVAWGGTVMAGSPQTHEGLVVLPAVLWVLVWPFQGTADTPRVVGAGALLAAVGVLAAGAHLGVASPMSPPNSLHWVPMGALAWLGGLLRWGVAGGAAGARSLPPGAVGASGVPPQPQTSSGSGQ